MTHVFHPGHHALHGVTVVIDTVGGDTYVGRFDTEDDRGVHLLDVGCREAAGGASREEFLRRSARFGIRVEQKHLLVPKGSVARVTPLGSLQL